MAGEGGMAGFAGEGGGGWRGVGVPHGGVDQGWGAGTSDGADKGGSLLFLAPSDIIIHYARPQQQRARRPIDKTSTSRRREGGYSLSINGWLAQICRILTFYFIFIFPSLPASEE